MKKYVSPELKDLSFVAEEATCGELTSPGENQVWLEWD